MTNLTEIIEACKRGEELARKLLYEKFSTRMRGVCYRYLGNKADADDILHESFITVFMKINQYSGKGSFEGWMKRICINTSLRLLKDRKNSFVSDDEDLMGKWDNDNSFTNIDSRGKEKKEDLIRRMNYSKEELMEILQSLPEGYRIVFNLYVIEKNSHKEIAELLNISQSTSKTQLFKARKHLQQKLYEESVLREVQDENNEYKDFLRIVI